MVDTPIPIESIDDPEKIRVKLLSSNREVHAPLSAVSPPLGTTIHGLTAKTTPVDADEFPLADSAAAFVAKKVTWANIKATLKTYFDTLYQPLASALISWAAITRASGFDTFVATPSSANLRSLLTDETGTGAAVFANTPTLVTPVVGAATATSINFGGSTLGTYTESTSVPTVGAASGTITTASATCNYTRIGNRILIQVKIVITTNGTGAGYVTATLPVTPTEEATLAGREIQATGVTLTGQITSGSTTLIIQDRDGIYPGANGRTFVLSGQYKT